MSASQCSVTSISDIEIVAIIGCARRRLVVIAPGLSQIVAQALRTKWLELGRDAVQVVIDTDPEVCRLGLGELAALELLQETAKNVGSTLLEQAGLRVGIIVTDESATIFSHLHS